MKNVRGYLRDGRMVERYIEGTFWHCQGVMYAAYGRFNLERVEFFVCDRWIVSPYLVNRLEAYNV